MSYILEALRRADAERQRGDVPGLHAQPQVMAAGDPPASPWPKAWVAGGALGLFALGGALVGWWTSGAETPPPLPVANAPAPTPAPTMAPPTALSPTPTMPVAPLPTTAALPSPPAPLAPTAPSPVAAARPVARALPLPAPAVPAAASAAAPAKVLKLSELPEDMRRELPAIAPGGSVYADHAPSRMVILNGQVFHEGDRPSPGLQVHQIRPRSVVFEFRGQRFELPL